MPAVPSVRLSPTEHHDIANHEFHAIGAGAPKRELHVVMKNNRKSSLRWMATGLVIAAAVVILDPSTFFIAIPSYGLTVIQKLLLAWIPASAALAWRPHVPLRWWLHYGLASFAVLLVSFSHAILTCHGGRSYDNRWFLPAAALLGYLVLASVIAAIIREWMWLKRRGDDNKRVEDIAA